MLHEHTRWQHCLPWLAKLLSKSKVRAGSPPEPLIYSEKNVQHERKKSFTSFFGNTYSEIPIFRTLNFSNHGTFPLDLLQSNTVILNPIFRTLGFSKLPADISNQFLPPMEDIYKKFTFDFSNPQESTIQ